MDLPRTYQPTLVIYVCYKYFSLALINITSNQFLSCWVFIPGIEQSGHGPGTYTNSGGTIATKARNGWGTPSHISVPLSSIIRSINSSLFPLLSHTNKPSLSFSFILFTPSIHLSFTISLSLGLEEHIKKFHATLLVHGSLSCCLF